MVTRYPKSTSIAMKPTPIQRLRAFPQLPAGFEILIKRDDLTGFALSGNKVRKLEFLLHDALRKKADTLITCGGFQSNHARATAIVGAELGFQTHLVLFGDGDPKLDGNLLLDKLVNAEITYISEDRYDQVDSMMLELCSQLSASGRKPYIIPEGASNQLGVWGYIRAAEEMKKQLQKMKREVNKIVTAVGSGGTYAGLWLGSRLLRWDVEIIGINVKDTARAFVDRIFKLITDTKEMFGLKVEPNRKDIRIVDGYVGEGYAKSRKEEVDLIKSVAENTGIILDPVYTGKAMYGLLEEIRKGRFSSRDKTLFIHTGGGFALFPIKERFI
ncbi:MAG: D-cysteine desulfhydrase family protein [Candidatus Zixiibacteriota bacterium]